LVSLANMEQVARDYRQIGKPGKSIHLTKKVVTLTHERFGVYPYRTLENLIRTLEFVGRREDALLYSEKMLNTARNLWGESSKQFLEARRLYMRSVQAVNQEDPRLLSFFEEDYKKTKINFGKFDARNEQTYLAIVNLASHYHLLGLYEKAEKLQIEFIKYWSNLDEHWQIKQSIYGKNRLAITYLAQAKYSQAKPLIEDTLKFWNKDGDSGQLLTAHLTLALINLHQNEKERSLHHSDKVLELGRITIDKIMWSSSKESRYSHINNIQSGINSENFILYSLKDGKGLIKKSLIFKELNTRTAKRMLDIARDKNDPKLKKVVKDILKNYKRIGEISSSKAKNIDSQIKDIKSKIEDLERELADKAGKFYTNKKIHPIDVVSKLEKNDVLIDFTIFNKLIQNTEYARTGEATLIAVIVNSKSPDNYIFVDLGPLNDIENIIKDLREEISDFESYSEEDIKETAHTAYERIWAPLSTHLEDARRIYIVPDGILHLLPFKALVDEEGKYLVETSNLINLTSIHDLFLPKTKTSNQDSVIISAPLYDPSQKESYAVNEAEIKRTSGKRSADLYFTPLPGTLEEGKRIETIFRENNQNVTLYKFEESTEKSLFKLNSPKILHIATHGFFLETDEKTAPKAGEQQNDPLLRSGLALTNANLGIKGEKQDDGSDGVLTSLEALGLQLNGTDLVVLSACETGVGEIRQGEGVNGLRGSFIQAGANSVLSTLWEISDSGTMEFMTRFYPPIIEGKNPQTSLQKTQREFINSDEWSHPFYWAPFVMVGRE